MNIRIPSLRTMGPLGRALAGVVATVVLVGAIILGAVLGALLIGIVLVGSLVVMGRVWWLRRRMRRVQPPPVDAPEGRPPIDAEFRVIEPPDPR